MPVVRCSALSCRCFDVGAWEGFCFLPPFSCFSVPYVGVANGRSNTFGNGAGRSRPLLVCRRLACLAAQHGWYTYPAGRVVRAATGYLPSTSSAKGASIGSSG